MDYNPTHSHETAVVQSLETSHGLPQTISAASEASEFLMLIIDF